MAKNAPDAGEDRHRPAADHGLLGNKEAHQGLRHGEANGRHERSPVERFLRLPQQQAGSSPEVVGVSSIRAERRMANDAARRREVRAGNGAMTAFEAGMWSAKPWRGRGADASRPAVARWPSSATAPDGACAARAP